MLLLSEKDVEKILNPVIAIEASEAAFKALYAKKANIPDRIILEVQNEGHALFKPGIVSLNEGQSQTLALKVVNVRDKNPQKNNPLPTCTAMISIFDVETGIQVCLMGGTFLTAMRTAAGSAIATRLYSNKDAAVLVIFGAGLQAYCHILTIMEVRNIKEIIIVNRTLDTANKLKRRLENIYEVTWTVLQMENTENVNTALSKADIICTATSAKTPLFNGASINKGCHINAVGSFLPTTTELDEYTVSRSSVILDSKKAKEVGDLKSMSSDYLLGTLGENLYQKKERNSASEFTLFKSVGVAVQDILTANSVYCLANKQRHRYQEFTV